MIQLLNDPIDCEWLRAKHLRRFDPAPFKSFEICGNEDAPTCVKTYILQAPSLFDSPLETFTQAEDGNLAKLIPQLPRQL